MEKASCYNCVNFLLCYMRNCLWNFLDKQALNHLDETAHLTFFEALAKHCDVYKLKTS